MNTPVGPLKYPRYKVWVWYVSHVERNMGRTGTRAVKAPILVEPYPTAAVSRRLASVQLRESMPWLQPVSAGSGALGLGHILEELAEGAGGAGAARLLAVDIVHGGVHPHAERKAVVYP